MVESTHSEMMLAEVMSWHESLWHEHIQAAASNRLAHALFLVGAEGTGKQRYAYQLAAKMLCMAESEQQQSFACGQCHSCQLVDSAFNRDGVHPDLHRIAPEKSGAFIKVDQIRALDAIVRQSAQLAGYRVIIIESANRLNVNAANALLKNLEEPGEQTLFVLLADSVAGILPTIRSRCQMVAMPEPTLDAAVTWLRGQGLSKLQAEQAQQVVGLRPLLVERLFDVGVLDSLIKVASQLAALVQQRIDSVSLTTRWLELPMAQLQLVLQQTLHRLAKGKLSGMSSSDDTVLAQSDQILLEHLDIKQLCYMQEGLERMAQLLNTAANPNPSLLLIDWLEQFQHPRSGAWQ